MTRALARTSVLRVALVAIAAAWLALAPAFAQQQLKFPAFTGYVVDDAGILSAQAKATLAQSLGQFQQARHQQIVVATVKDLQGTAIEDYGYQLGRAWGVGERGKDTGAILLVAPKDRAVRIEVGYGLEGELTDAVSRQIIEQTILPAFRAGDYDRGVILGVRGIMAALGYQPSGGASAPVPAKSTGQIPSFVFFIFIFLLFAFLRAQSRVGTPGSPWRRSSRGVYPVIFPGGFGGGGGGFGGGFGGGGGGSFGGGGATGRW